MLSCCMCVGVSASKSAYESTTYVLTNSHLYVDVDNEQKSCCACCVKGHTTNSMPLHEMRQEGGVSPFSVVQFS